MRNKTVAKTFAEAMKAPMGSTKREKARRLISVLHKTVAKHDGMGGPGYPAGGVYSKSGVGTYVPSAAMPAQDPVYREMVMFKAPPTHAPDARGNPKYDGQGGPGYSALTAGGGSSIPQFAGIGSGLSVAPSGMVGAPAPSTTSDLLRISGTPSAGQPQPLGISYKDPSKLDITSPLSLSKFSYAPTGQQPLKPSVPQVTPSVPSAPAGAPVTPAAPTTAPVTPTPTTTTPTAPAGGQITEAPKPSGVGQFKDLTAAAKGAIAKDVGPTSFAYGAMNDINILRELMPGVPDDDLPVGASLSGQINGLKETLKKEYDIDTLQGQLDSKIRQGVTIEDDLKDYIRGKDDYLNGIDQMLGDAKNRSIELAGGPSAGVMTNYVNYLTTLKGRQNKRYIEFYDGAITQYNNELTGLQNRVNSALTNYQEELKTESVLKQDDYNRLFTGLTELYNTVSAAPQKALEMQILQEQLNQARVGAANSGINAVNTDWIKEYGTLKTNNIIFNKDTGALQPQVQSLEPTIETIMSNGNTDIGGANRMLGEAIANDLYYDPAGGDFSSYVSKVTKYENMLTDYAREASSPSFQSKYGVDITPTISNMASNLASRVGESVANQVLGNPGVYKDAMGDLVSPGMFGMGKKQSRDQFVSGHKNNDLPAGMLEKMYDFYSVLQTADPRGTTAKNFIKMPDEEFARTLADGIGKSFFTGPSAVSSLSS